MIKINTFDELAEHMIIKDLKYHIWYMDGRNIDQAVTGYVTCISDTLIIVLDENTNRTYRIKRDSVIEFKYLHERYVLKGVQQENIINIGDSNNEISNN